MTITMSTRNGDTYELDESGNVLKRENGMTFPPDGNWRIVGFGRRANSRQIIPFADVVAGADFGKGWIFDRDHGRFRQWGMDRLAWLRFDA